jgi:hypothetical protein
MATKQESLVRYIFSPQQSDSVPFYRWLNPTSGDHICCQDPIDESSNPAYRSKWIACYILPSTRDNAVALYRYYSAKEGTCRVAFGRKGMELCH